MKSTRNNATTLLATLGLSLALAAGAQAQATAPAKDANPGATVVTPSNTPDAKQQRGMGHSMGSGMGMDSGMKHGKGHGKRAEMKGQRSEMSKLMSPEERTAMREKMQAAKTPEERQALRTSMRTEMEKRAKEKGITLPEYKGGRHQHGNQAG